MLESLLISPNGLHLYSKETPTHPVEFSVKMMNACLRNCRSIFTFVKKKIKDTKSETRRKILGEQLSSF